MKILRAARQLLAGRAQRRALGIHSSGRFDRPIASLAASVRRLRRVARGRGPLRRRVAFITGTEAGGRSDAELEQALGSDPTWDYVNLKGPAAECWATWRTSMLERNGRPYSRQLSDITWTRSKEYGGKEAAPVKALVVPLRVVGRPNRRHIYLVVIHMPLDNTELRAQAWVDCCRGLRALVVDEIRTHDPHAEIVIEADWNKDHRNDRERDMIRKHVARPLRLVQGWDGSRPGRGGTHGRRLIDGVVSSRRFLGWSTPWCWLTADDNSSDHRPYVHTVRWPLLPQRSLRSSTDGSLTARALDLDLSTALTAKENR